MTTPPNQEPGTGGQCTNGGAHGHMVVPYDQGACQRGVAPNFKQKVGFLLKFGILIDYMPVINGFSPFLGDIGHFWSPNFGRKLGMDNQLQYL
jgi:hypothetical protein